MIKREGKGFLNRFFVFVLLQLDVCYMKSYIICILCWIYLSNQIYLFLLVLFFAFYVRSLSSRLVSSLAID